MPRCIYCNGTGYESVKVTKYDSAMNQDYETNESHMCQYCDGKAYFPESQSPSSALKDESPEVTKSSTQSKAKEPDIAGNIAGLSLIFTGIIAYLIYHDPSSEMNIFVATGITFVISNILLHIIYGLFKVMTKLAEFVLAITFWAIVITGIAYVADASWPLELISYIKLNIPL